MSVRRTHGRGTAEGYFSPAARTGSASPFEASLVETQNLKSPLLVPTPPAVRTVTLVADAPSPKMVELAGSDRERAVPVVIDSFVGIYRWHARRTLREVARVRAVEVGGEVAGISMIQPLVPGVGYVYYLAVRRAFRRRGIGGALLDDALRAFQGDGTRVVYGAAEEENAGSIALFLSRGFRVVERRELGYREGGLGAWGLRSRMWIVSGEVLLGRRLAPEPAAHSPP
ncbi:MAG: GNAT family N-acetyltransferase [Thermoplasmata archaeon]